MVLLDNGEDQWDLSINPDGSLQVMLNNRLLAQLEAALLTHDITLTIAHQNYMQLSAIVNGVSTPQYSTYIPQSHAPISRLQLGAPMANLFSSDFALTDLTINAGVTIPVPTTGVLTDITNPLSDQTTLIYDEGGSPLVDADGNYLGIGYTNPDPPLEPGYLADDDGILVMDDDAALLQGS